MNVQAALCASTARVSNFANLAQTNKYELTECARQFFFNFSSYQLRLGGKNAGFGMRE
jgi:hypothetical protein